MRNPALFFINMAFCMIFAFAVKAYMDSHGFSAWVTVPLIIFGNAAFCLTTIMVMERPNSD